MFSAKALIWGMADAEARRPGERSRLDTGVVQAVNDAVSFLEESKTQEMRYE
jgi:hypothetical protein